MISDDYVNVNDPMDDYIPEEYRGLELPVFIRKVLLSEFIKRDNIPNFFNRFVLKFVEDEDDFQEETMYKCLLIRNGEYCGVLSQDIVNRLIEKKERFIMFRVCHDEDYEFREQSYLIHVNLSIDQ